MNTDNIRIFGLVFPGQGSQTVGMLAELAEQYPVIHTTFREASEFAGYDIWSLVQHGPVEKLNQTEFTQVAMLVADIALYHVFKAIYDVKPIMLAGHSLGEYAALVAAGALSFADGVRLVQARGRLMQKHVPTGVGAMAAIVGLDDEAVKNICNIVSNDSYKVMPANYNAIGQVVIAGHTIAVEHAIKLAEAQAAKLAKIIPVSVPCHCDLLKSAAKDFQKILQDIQISEPEIIVISNVTAKPYSSSKEIRQLLAEQLYSAVRWVDTIKFFANTGVTDIWELGPGKVLSGLIKRIEKNIQTHIIC
jgi:[acyl-carrier-protein] S-malonyltransferase